MRIIATSSNEFVFSLSRLSLFPGYRLGEEGPEYAPRSRLGSFTTNERPTAVSESDGDQPSFQLPARLSDFRLSLQSTPTAFTDVSEGSADPTASEPSEPDMAALAQKANNPLSDVWLLLSQNDTTLFEGDLLDHTEVFNSLKIQPVMPIPILD